MAHQLSEVSDEFNSTEDGDESDTTIRMSPTGFWNAVEHLTVPNNLKLSESTPPSTYTNYPGCLEFGITRLFDNEKSICKTTRNGSGIGPETITFPLLTYEEFRLLGDLDKMQYFDKMTSALNRWAIFKKSCPRIDEFVLRHYDNNNRLPSDEFSLSVEKNIQEKWRLTHGPSINSILSRPCHMNSNLVRWSDDRLQWNSTNMRLDLDPAEACRLHTPLEQTEFERCLHRRGLLYHIASPQLLYRLNILVGKIRGTTGDVDQCLWDMTDKYKCSWNISIYHTDNVSVLKLWDFKGSARAEFSGLEEIQVDALDLINFVTSFKFTHTYDNLIAGAVA